MTEPTAEPNETEAEGDIWDDFAPTSDEPAPNIGHVPYLQSGELEQ
jgi:hypothetical protein